MWAVAAVALMLAACEGEKDKDSDKKPEAAASLSGAPKPEASPSATEAATPATGMPSGLEAMRAVFPDTDAKGVSKTAPREAGKDEPPLDMPETKAMMVVGDPDHPVLFAGTTDPGACHSCLGYVSIYYLKRDKAGWAVDKSFPGFLPGNGFGGTGDVKPIALRGGREAYAHEAGWTGQGVTCGWMSVFLLKPEGPVKALEGERMFFGDGNDPKGKVTDGEVLIPSKAHDLEIGFADKENGRPKSFTGYNLKGDKLVLVEGKNPVRDGC
jgi:hypothetical protein